MFKELSREEANVYLEDRRQKGFNLIQAVLLAEYHDASSSENKNQIAGLGPNYYGHEPLLNSQGRPDPTRPNVREGSTPKNPNDYWDHVDFVLDCAARQGLYVAVLPVWGRNYVAGTRSGRAHCEIFKQGNAKVYGRFVGQRLKTHQNIIWVLGGDMPAVRDGKDYRPVFRAMAEGIAQGATGRSPAWNEPSKAWDQLLMTYHGRFRGEEATWDWFGEDDVWLDIHDAYSGHQADKSLAYHKVQKAYKIAQPKPVINLEPPYEDHPQSFNPKKFGFFRDWDVRQAAYWSVFAGAAGHTYGHHAIWQFRDADDKAISYVDRYWIGGDNPAKDRPGAFQMGYLRQLIESRCPGDRLSDQSMITSAQPADPDRQLRAIRGKSWACIYTPHGTSFEAALEKFDSSEVTAEWFCPREGKSRAIGTFPAEGSRAFDPPGKPGSGNDWVLVLKARTRLGRRIGSWR